MASIGKKPVAINKDGKEVWQVSWRDPDGKQRSKRIIGKKQALAFKAKIEHELNTGTLIPKSKDMTLGEWLERWLETKETKEYKTFTDYELIALKHLKPELGHITLSQLKPIVIEKYYTKKLKEGRLDGKEGGLNPKTIAKHHRVLRMALQKAVANDLILYNPADRVTDVPKPDKDKVGQKLTPEMIKTISKLTRATQIELIVKLALSLGLRLGEVLAMKWCNLDWERHLYIVRETLQRQKIEGEDGTVTSQLVFKQKPKSGKKRIVPVPAGLLTRLAETKKRQEETKERLGILFTDFDLINCQEDGTPWEPSNISNKWSKLIGPSLPGVRFHDLRHTFVSILVQDLGIDYRTASSLAGHADPGFTITEYSHSEFEYERSAIQQLETHIKNLLNGDSGTD